MDALSQTLSLLSAMITPVVLIMASSSLILSTSQRLNRSIERTRKVSDAIKAIINEQGNTEESGEFAMLFQQLKLASRRARLLQSAMTALYVTLFFFVASCISIAMVYYVFDGHAWLPIALDLVGVGLLCYASVLLVKESSVAVSAVGTEMRHTMRQFEQYDRQQKRK